MSSHKSVKSKLWVVVDHAGHVIHHASDPEHIPFMTRYVEEANRAGDEWSLLEYDFSHAVSGSLLTSQSKAVQG